ncbi:MAG: class I SAM-dependent methyltransferase [Alkalispirochaeta sp.]
MSTVAMNRKSYRLTGDGTEVTFGNPVAKREYNRSLFSIVAPRYDIATRVLSFGRDQAWKRTLLEKCGVTLEQVATGPEVATEDPAVPSQDQNRPLRILDIACGTGDLTQALAARFPEAEVIGVDLNREMLAEATRRLGIVAAEGGRGPDPSATPNVKPVSIQFLEGDMSALPFPDGTFDLVTAGYALRNAPDLPATLAEIRRVLAPVGVLGILEFSRSPRPAVSAISGALLQSWGSIWGVLLHGDAAVYGYIARSLAHYPDRTELAGLLRNHGFPRLDRTLRMFGLIEITVATG